MAVDSKRVIQSLSGVSVSANEDGLIPAFSVLVNRMPASLWSNFAELITNSVVGEISKTAEFLLVNAAHECGYHTGYGIITSEEWKAVVAPMVQKEPEDVLHGAFAVFTAWGWGKTELVDLQPGEKAVVRAYDYYEADVVQGGASNRNIAYMIRGVSAAFMDLAYGKPYPDGMRTFECMQTKGIEAGDMYGEFVVTRAKDDD